MTVAEAKAEAQHMQSRADHPDLTFTPVELGGKGHVVVEHSTEGSLICLASDQECKAFRMGLSIGKGL